MEVWKTVKFEELNILLSGCHPDFPQVFFKCNWIQDSCGFRLAKGVKKKDDTILKINPRICNKINFAPTVNFAKKYLASEGIVCSASSDCKLINGKCGVALKLKYLKKNKVAIYVRNSDHGPNFIGVDSRKTPHYIRTQIRDNDEKQRNLGKIGVTPFSTTMEMLAKNKNKEGEEKHTEIPVPKIKEIENILYYCRKSKLKLDPMQELDEFVKASKSIVYPVNNNDYPVHCFDAGLPVVIVLVANEQTIENFFKCCSEEFYVWGMDSQYVNNNLRLPLTIICAQNEHRETIPGFIALSLKSDEQHYTIILNSVKNYCKARLRRKVGYVMIDKCRAERNAAVSCGSHFLLCQFHILRTINGKINKLIHKDEKTACIISFYF